MKALGQALDKACDADLVDHLGELAGAGGPEKLAHPRVGAGDDRLGSGIGIFLAAAHHRQHAVFRTRLAAGHRRVDELEACLGGGGVELAGHLGGGGGVVDEYGALFHAGEGAVGADRDRAQVIVVADAAHHEILTFGRFLRRRRGAPAEFVRPFLRLGAGPVVHGHLVAAFFHQMSCHGETHYAETEKSDFSHMQYLESFAGDIGRAGRCSWREPHHTRCAGEGNAFVWRAGPDLC